MKRTEGVEKKRRWTWQAGLFHASRLLLGGILIYAGIEKILTPRLFAEAVYNYQILPEALINLAALVLPWLELLLGILIVVEIWLPGAVLLSSLLLLTFSGILIFNMSRGLNISCGCFSTEPATDPISLWTVIRDVSFLVPAVYLLFADRAEKQAEE